jgi:hypothetical protein
MSFSDKIRFIDFEISSICNAACPVCPRNDRGRFTNFNQTYWKIDDVIETIDIDIIKGLRGLSFCGNFGDPMGNPDIVKIIKYFKVNNAELPIWINTNGGIGSVESYVELAKLGVKIIFGIDGYGDKNELYRVNVKWDKLLKNIIEFSKHCDMNQLEIQFIMWNETTDQILPIIGLLKELKKGIIWLRKPYTGGEKTEVYNIHGESTHFLTEIKDDRLLKYLDTRWEYKNIHQLEQEIINLKLKKSFIEYSNYKKTDYIAPKTAEPYRKTQVKMNVYDDTVTQTCYSKNNENPDNLNDDVFNLFITHNKLLMPCCMIPPNISTHINFSVGEESNYQKEILNKLLDIGVERFSLEGKTLRTVFDSGVIHKFVYNDLMQKKSFEICKTICGKQTCSNK